MLIANIWMASADGSPNPAGTMFTLVGFMAIFYFLFVRPQQRQRKDHDAMVGTLSKGDEIVTVGGIVGTIVHIAEDRLTIRSGETRLEVDRNKVSAVTKQDA